MDSCELVTRAVEFRKPDRLPLRFESLGLSDIGSIRWNYTGSGNPAERQSLDEWGCLWVRTAERNMGQVRGHPLAEWASLAQYRFPNPDDPACYTGVEQRFAGLEGKYIQCEIFMLLFERLQALRGFENTLTDLYRERERIEWLADRVVEYDLGILENLARRFPGRFHGFWFTEDWGTQQALMVRPSLWEEFFKPRYRRIFDFAHACGWHVWMHSCGKVNAILENLIEIGVNVVNLQQPRLLGIEEVGRHFAGRLCFESLCDIQRTLPFEGDEAIRAEAELLLQHWGTPEGGFILSDYGDGEAIGVPVEKKQVMLDAFLAADRWRGNTSPCFG
jgi:uroporphyrinogen decarboxylase